MNIICQTSHPATTVEHSIECHFYNLLEKNLVVAGANQLTIYKIEAKLLQFVQSFVVYGTVASLQKVSLGNKQLRRRDSLVLSFNDAKLSIVEYNPENHDLKTISMHYFEDDNLREGCVTNHMHPPIVRVDPEDRCLAMLIYGCHIVLIPFDKDEEDLENELYNTSSDEDEEDEDESMQVDNQELRVPTAGQVVAHKPNVNSNFKSPILPSYKIDLSEETCGEKINNIVDIQFLYNYNDPTLVILYEPVKTWSGRIAMRQDTFSMVALSMNVQQRLQPIIWTVNNLPYDSFKILPVPKPIGGLLVIACNELIYLNQSVPAFGMSFNSFTKDSSAFPFNNQVSENDKIDYLNISLDLSQAAFLTCNKILFILKEGDVYLVTLSNDDMRSIKSCHFERIASTVQPNCLTWCENNFIFIGSHVGDSVLAELVGDFKSENLDAYYDDMDSLISNDVKEPINFYEHDQIISTSASGRICYGEASNVSDNLHHDSSDPYVELITTAGYHKNGSVCVFQRTIKPQVDDTYELKDCGEIWTMKASKQSDPTDTRLILNRDFETMVFSTKGELLELKRDGCAFETNEPTIFASNIGTENLTIQVMSSIAKLISNDKTIDSVKIDGEVLDVSMADPHIVALTKDNSVHHIELKSSIIEDKTDSIRQYGLSCHNIGSLTVARIISISLYKDTSGLFNCKSEFYHDSKPSHWLLVVDDRGVLEIFSVPDFVSVYSVDNFPSAPNVLADNIKTYITDLDVNVSKTKEILMLGLGRNNKKPLLFVRSETELIIYEAYHFNEIEIPRHLKLRFKKITSILLLTIIPNDNALEYKPEQQAITDGRSKSRHNHNSKLPNLKERWLQKRHWLKEFRNLNGLDGVFLAGFRPHWFMMSDRCSLRIHPITVEGAIYAFSQYDDNNFIYFTENRELRIARLTKQFNYDHHWPIRKINLKETVHFVNYHIDRKVYCVVSSSPKICLKIMKVGSEPDTMKIEDLERENGYIPPATERFRLRLFDPESWDEIPDSEIEFEEWEQVTCVKNVSLASEGTTSGLKGYIAMSTNYCYGEDVPNRGRIWILDLIEVVPEPDRPLTKNKIKKVYCQEQKGPVTTLSHTCGLLMSAVGQKIYLWQLKEEQLDGVAFIDTQVFIHCAASVKNLILVSDVCKSMTLLRYQQETRTLSMVSRDSKQLEVFACDFIVDNELLNFVVADSEKNLIIYAHDPENDDSHGGTRLLRKADFFLGEHLTNFTRIRGKIPTKFSGDSNEALFYRRKHITLYSTVDGAIGYLYPIHESAHKRLQMLQNEMTVALPHVAGLNPKAWRLIKQARPSIANPCKGIIDIDIINRFLLISSRERNELTRKIGTNADKILADLQLIQESTLYF